MKFLYWFLKILAYIPLGLLYPTIVRGRKNLGKGKAILVCNHQSNLDPILISLWIPKQCYFLSKQELFNGKIMAKFIRHIGGIPVDRKNVGLSTIKETLKLLNNGERVVIFPEGTRKKISLEEGEALKNGAAMFALKAQSKIVPMYFVKKPSLFRFNKLIIGEPINIDEYFGQKTSKENIETVGEKIKDALMELKNNSVKGKKNG